MIKEVVQGRTRPITFQVRDRRTNAPTDLTGMTVTMTLVRMRDNFYGEDFGNMDRGTGPQTIALANATMTVDPDQTVSGNRGRVSWDPMNDGLSNDSDGGSLEVIGSGYYLVQLKVVDGASDIDFAPAELDDLILRVTPRLGATS